MSRPKEMTRAVIVGHKSILKETIDALHDINLFTSKTLSKMSWF